MSIANQTRTGSDKIGLWLAWAFSLAAMSAAHAFTLAPLTQEYSPSGRGASQAYQVINDSDQDAAVQISILSREVDLDGKERNTPAEDDFIVFPWQMVLKPKQIQTVRVKWVGNAKPVKELAYRILAEEMPINLTKTQSDSGKAAGSVKVVLRYLGAIYIVPKGARGDVVIDPAAVESGEAGERKLAIVFENRGAAHTLLNDLRLTFQAGSKAVNLGPEDLKGVAGENILAGNRRRFVIPRPTGLPDGPVKVGIELTRPVAEKGERDKCSGPFAALARGTAVHETRWDADPPAARIIG